MSADPRRWFVESRLLPGFASADQSDRQWVRATETKLSFSEALQILEFLEIEVPSLEARAVFAVEDFRVAVAVAS